MAALGALAVIGLIVVTIGGNVRGWRDRFQSRTTKPQIATLGVLPLENLSSDPGQDYLAAGLTDELITMLAKNSTLRIISRTSVMQYKEVNRPLRDIAWDLGVDGILEGSVARTGTRVHMTIQLIHAPSDTHVWAESYDRNLDTIVSLPRDAAQTIAKQLKSAAAPVGPQRLINPEAHDAYLRGRYYWISFKTSKAGEYFKKAVELQPDYALGWSGLADFYGRSAMIGLGSPRVFLPQLTAAAAKALELDDSLAEAHTSAGAGYLFNWNWERADMESARAVELRPDFAEAHHLRSYVLAARNRMDEGLEEQKRSTELDPLVRPWAMGRMFMRMRQFDAMLNDARLRVAAQPEISSLRDLLSDAYWYKGMEKEAVQELEEQQLLDGDKATAAAIRRAFHQGGYKAVRKAGITVCCGGILGLGESETDRCRLLAELASMHPPPESVPINLLVPIEGTPLGSAHPVKSTELIRVIAVARLLIPKSRVRLSAGRLSLSHEAQLFAFFAGANSIFIGDKLLTTPNVAEDDDRRLLAEVGA